MRLYSAEKNLLSEIAVGREVVAFSGFDSGNGYFYTESTYDYYSWGYSHPGNGLTMGKVEGNQLQYVDTFYSFLESSMISRSMSCMLYLCQEYYMYHQRSADFLNDKYLVATSALHGQLYVYDSDTCLLYTSPSPRD